MKVGVVKETKTDEFRVAMTPAGAHDLVEDGHVVLIESGAGDGSRITDDDFAGAGGTIVDSPGEVWAEADMIVKVKEPQQEEFAQLRDDLVLFTYLHLAAYPAVAHALLDAKTTALAYETVQLDDRSLPLLAPMSEVAGRMSVQVGARFLEKEEGGRGILLGGVPGVEPANVLVIGAGMAGSNAVQIAAGMGADVHVFDINPAPLRRIDEIYRGLVKTMVANQLDVKAAAANADLVIGAVLLPGARAPRVLSAADISTMKPGSVVVDIAIDQGGCFETSRETKHSDPIYLVDGVLHYAVGNIPGVVPRTSTFALTNATLPYIKTVANHGVAGAMAARPELELGLNCDAGHIRHPAVAEALSA